MEMEHERSVKFVQWYKDLLENHRERIYVYVSPDIYLDWFGRVVKGSEQVTTFFKKTSAFEHRIDNVEARAHIWHRDFKLAKTRPTRKCNVATKTMSTAPNNGLPDVPHVAGCSHGHNFPEVSVNADQLESSERDDGFRTPEKTSVTIRYPDETGAGDATRPILKYVAVFGTLYFSDRSCESSDFNTRPLKLKIAYTEDVFGNEYTVKYIIYETKNKCRRNLMSQFQSVSNEVTDNKCN